MTTHNDAPRGVVEPFRLGMDVIPDWFMDHLSANRVVVHTVAHASESGPHLAGIPRDKGNPMSYSIYIGNAELDSVWTEDERSARWFVPWHAEPDAPAFPFDGMTGNGNGRHPGYQQWAEFCDATGLRQMFYGERDSDGCMISDGILSQHPGCVVLTASMQDTVRSARGQWQDAHPDAVPGWDYDPGHMAFKGSRHVDDGVRGRDGILARLLWLEWWMTWALDNCERPAVSNT